MSNLLHALSSAPLVASPPLAERPAFAQLLARWRQARHLSQLRLAQDCEVSQKHIAYLELGRTRPSRAMVLTLGAAMYLPLHERNALLISAGFSAMYSTRRLDDPSMKAVDDALSLMLRHHEPNPALVCDRDWNILRRNEAMKRLMRRLTADRIEEFKSMGRARSNNALHVLFHPQGLRPLIRNWQEAAVPVIARLRREEAITGRASIGKLVSELLEYPGVSTFMNEPDPGAVVPPVVVLDYETPDQSFRVRLFTLCSTFGTAQDVTTDELRIEHSFPADAESAETLRVLAESPIRSRRAA